MWIEVVEKSDSDIDMSKKRGDSAVHNHYYDHQVEMELCLLEIKVENRKSRVEGRMLKVESRMLKIDALSVCPLWHTVDAIMTTSQCNIIDPNPDPGHCLYNRNQSINSGPINSSFKLGIIGPKKT